MYKRQVYFLISLLVVAQTVLYASFDVIGGEEDNAAFVLQPVINADEVAENGVSQFVALVEDDERGVEEGDEGDSVVQRVSQISPIGGGTHLAGYLPHEIAFLHVLAAKEVEDVAVCTAVLDCGRGFTATGIAHYPGGIFISLCIGHSKSYARKGAALGQCPTLKVMAYLCGYPAEHVIADAGVLRIADL